MLVDSEEGNVMQARGSQSVAGKGTSYTHLAKGAFSDDTHPVVVFSPHTVMQ